MSKESRLEKIAVTLALCAVGLVFGGTKACQEDYELGAQSTVAKTGTPASTPTAGGDDGLATRTPTPAQTVAATPTPTPTVTPTRTVTATPTASKAHLKPGNGRPVGGGLLQELSALSEGSSEEKATAAAHPKSAVGADANWLGKGFSNETAQESGKWRDADLDGFSDDVEQRVGADLSDPLSTPMDLLSTSLDSRLGKSDPDFDGLTSEEEKKRGTNPQSLDSDGDGKPDGAEVVSGGDPVDPHNRYLDRDGDSLGDEYEAVLGTKADSLDSDEDGLRDDIELVIGSDPQKVDSDGDGVSDGREYDLGSDPTVVDGAE